MAPSPLSAFASLSWPQRLLDRAPSLRAGAVAEAERHLARLDDDYEELGRKLRWVSLAFNTTPSSDATRGPLRATAKELGDVSLALRRVLDSARDTRVAPLLAQGTPLIRYLHGLYDWMEDLLVAFDEIARVLRAKPSAIPLFRYRRYATSFGQFDAVTQSVHANVLCVRPGKRADSAARTLDERLEELFWAASWLHMSLTRRYN